MLDGVRIVDLSRILAGPFATQGLAQMGADVIKVESPDGDPGRQIGPFVGERSLYFSSLNSGKRSVVLDLKTEVDRQHLADLIASADIVVDNFRPSALATLGIDRAAVLDRHPQLVWVSISGFRSSSERAHDPAYDLSAQAEGGIMAVTGHPGGEPARAGVAISDLSTGLWAAIAILAAYVKSLRTGKGSLVEVPLVDSTMTLLSYIATTAVHTTEEPGPVGSGHHTLVPYGAYPTSDGWIAIAVIGDKFWRHLVTALELSETDGLETNAQRNERREAVDSMVALATAKLTTAEAIARFGAADVPHAPIRSVLDAISMPYGQGAVQVLETESGPYTVINAPTGPRPDLRPAPLLGQHTDEVLSDLVGTTD